MNTCPDCQGNLVEKIVNICACDTLPAVIVKNVPALVCERCEEKILSQNVIDIFQAIQQGKGPEPAYEMSAVFDYKEAL